MRRLRSRGRAASDPDPEPPVDDRLFCRLPFSEVNVMEHGWVYPNCCPDWVEFPLGNLLLQSWDEVWNGPNAQRFRQSMIDGDLRHCDGEWCPHMQDAKAGRTDWRVARHSDLTRLDLPHEALEGQVVMAARPTRVGLHYDWSCNLACPSCRDGIEVVEGDAYDVMSKLHAAVEAELLPHAESISMTGTGDPFASKFCREVLSGFDRARYPRLREVHLHTNAIMWTPAMWERMPGLHDIDLSTDVSIDAATADTFHVVRAPARWDRLMANLDFIIAIPNLRSFGISMTVSRLNYREIVDFYSFGQALAEKRPELPMYVEYKRVRRRDHHLDGPWSSLALEALDADEHRHLIGQLGEIDRLRASGTTPEIRSNLAEFLDHPATPVTITPR